jgi:tetratricopeptide (TPR) repeat protein
LEALESYDKAIAIDPNLTNALANCRNILNLLGRYIEAIESYDKVITLNPNLAGAWAGRGNAFMNLDRFSDAIISNDKTIAIKPDLSVVSSWNVSEHTQTVFRSINIRIGSA